MTVAQQIGNIGERLNLLIRQGATFGPYRCTMTNPDGSPVDLTGASIVGQIRKRASDATAVADLQVTMVDRAAGVYEFGLSDETSAGITAGSDTTRPESLYVWDMELHDSLGRVIPLYYGDVRVFREVTRV